MTITYQLGEKLYINLTNQCSNDCKFCVRRFKDGVGSYNLWLDEEPTAEEVIEDIADVNKYEEIVFCGYGEPLVKVDTLLKVSHYLKDNYPQVPIRINTNGQANLIHNKNILPQLEGVIDIISISLNAHNAIAYQEICQSDFGLETFPGIIKFIKEAKVYIPKVVLSIVNYSTVNIEACKQLAKGLNLELKVRDY